MTTSIYSKSATQSSLQINGVDAIVFDATGVTSGIAPAIITPAMLTTASTPLGVGQTWQNVVGSRVLGTTYYNTTGRPITVYVAVYATGAHAMQLTVNGIVLQATGTTTLNASITAIIPSGGNYVATDNGTTPIIDKWAELR